MVFLFLGLMLIGVIVVVLVHIGNEKEHEQRDNKRSNYSYIEVFNIVILVINILGGIYLAYTLSLTVKISDSFEIVSELNYLTLTIYSVIIIAYSFFIFALIKAFIELKNDTKEIIDQNYHIMEKLLK